MMNFGNHVIRQFSWSGWKALVTSKNLIWQHDDDGTKVTAYGYDGPEVIITTIWNGQVPDGILQSGLTQEQNDANLYDWTYSYLPWSNKPIESRTKDGRHEVRHTSVRRLQNFNLRVFSFYTARPGSLHNVNPVDGKDWADVKYTMYDEQNVETDEPAGCVKTVVDFEPRYDYEIVGGFSDVPDSIQRGTTDKWFLGGVGIPDLPAQMYGSIPYVSEVNLEAVQAARIVSDGRATSFLPYKYAGYPTNKIRFYIKHPPGATERFQFYLEHFT